MRRTGPTNYQVQELISSIGYQTSPFWKRIAKDIQKPTRQRRSVNIYKINKYAKEGETVIVPGKVLSVGEISKKVTVVAMNFSSEAKRKIEAANGKTVTIKELFAQNPEGKGVRILG